MAQIEIPSLKEIAEAVRQVVREELERFAASRSDEMVSIEETAERLDLSVATVRRRVKAGDLPSKRIGHQYRIPGSALRPISDEEIAELAHSARR
jgi:excisionase family DNA binding protein